MTIQNAPPGLDYDRDKKFSKVLVFFLSRCIILFKLFQLYWILRRVWLFSISILYFSY